jgi:hypothetical protein
VADGKPAPPNDTTTERANAAARSDPAEPAPSARARLAHKVMPHTFQGRLTLAFVAILALTLILVTTLVLNRLGDYFDQQQRQDLRAPSALPSTWPSWRATRATFDR